MQVRCIRPFSQYQPGDVTDVPDGAATDPFHWEAVTVPADPSPDPPAAPRLPVPPKEM